MRIKPPHFLSLCTVVLGALLASECSAAKIEAIKGKQYRLTKRHGPWMIMVASFNVPPPEIRSEGMTPEEAANELVFELRKKGIPAYTFSQEDVIEQIPTTDRLGRQRMSYYLAQKGAVCVLAGNYQGNDDVIGQKTLAYVKRFFPNFLKDESNGGRFRPTPGRPGPLSGAFLTVNPLLSPEEALQRKHDPLILKLNVGTDYSLLHNQGKYTVVVASFYGKSLTQFVNGKLQEAEEKFDSDIGNSLDDAALQAWQLTRALRQAKSLGYDQDYEAFVYHDRFRSIVTIGSFDSPDDPRIARLQQFFGAKTRTHPETGQSVLSAERYTIPRRLEPNQQPDQSWIFDPYPKVMEVPRF